MHRHGSNSSFETTMGYVRCVDDGSYVHISGTTGYNYNTMQIDPDPAQQAEQCLRNIEAALAQSGVGFADVVRVRYILPDRADFEPCWPILRRYFGAHPPAATMLVAGLYDPAMKLEIEVTARHPRTASAES